MEEKELTLREIYYSPKLGYRSIEQLYQLAHKENEDISRKFVKKWLETQESYTKYKRFNHPRHFRRTVVRDLGEQVQIDLVVFLSKHSTENDGYKYFFVGIEILSRFAFAYPLMRKDGLSVKVVMKKFLEDFYKRFKKYPELLQMDEGSEFLNKDVKSVLEEHDITYFSTVSKRKASIVERLNRTLKNKILKIFEHRGSHRWIDILFDVIENYNSTVHSSIAIAPRDVNEENKYIVWMRLYGKSREIKKPKFHVGEHVRVLDLKLTGQSKTFKKYFEKKEGKRKNIHMVESRDKPPFSNEVFEIVRVLYHNPVVYKLYSEEADVDILGKFYEDELSRVE